MNYNYNYKKKLLLQIKNLHNIIYQINHNLNQTNIEVEKLKTTNKSLQKQLKQYNSDKILLIQNDIRMKQHQEKIIKIKEETIKQLRNQIFDIKYQIPKMLK